MSGSEGGSEGGSEALNTDRLVGKGDRRDDGGDDPADEFEDDPESDAADDAQQTVEAFADSDAVESETTQQTGSDVTVEVVSDPTELTSQQDMVSVELEDGEVVVGRVYDDTEGAVIIDKNFEIFDEDNHDFVEIDTDRLESDSVRIERYDTVDLTDLPGVEPLSADEGGYNEITSGTADAETLVSDMRTVDEWCEASDINEALENHPITDQEAQQVRERIADNLSRVRDDELRREYAKRTIIGNDSWKAGNAPIFTKNGRPMNVILKSNTPRPADIPHEMGHGLTQMSGYVVHCEGGISKDPDSGQWWDTKTDPRNTTEFQKYMHVKSGVRNRGGDRNIETAHGWDDWHEDAESRIQTAENSDSDDLPTVDELRTQYSADGWEEKMDNFASQANRAFYEMHLRNAVNGTKKGIVNGYSAYHSQETIAQMNELFQTNSIEKSAKVERVVKNYPEVTAAYLEMFEPSDTVKNRLRDIDGVSVD